MKNKRVLFAAAISSLLFLSGCASTNSSSSQTYTAPSSTPEYSATPSKWESAGYSQWGSVWGIWLHEGDAGWTACSYGTCSKIKVVSETGCSMLYVEANILDSTGTVIGMANDTVSNLAPDQPAIMELHYVTSGGHSDKIKLTEVNCY